MISNNEYREKLVAEIRAQKLLKSNRGAIKISKLRLQEYDRLHKQIAAIQIVDNAKRTIDFFDISERQHKITTIEDNVLKIEMK